MTEIQAVLFAHQDEAYRDFIARSVPNVPKERFIGVRSPEYKKIMKELPEGAADGFPEALPHAYFEENVVHAILLSKIPDFAACLQQVERFLPYVDNWAVCDGLNPPALGKNLPALKENVVRWIASEEPFTRRFGMRMVMIHFLEEHFDEALLKQAAALRSQEYYVNMMTAWLFAEALVKQWDAALPYLDGQHLDKWTHNKAIQKAIESRRFTDEQKAYLRSLRVKGAKSAD